jgi:uncharacterized membrane protein
MLGLGEAELAGFNDWSVTALTPLPGWLLAALGGALLVALWVVVASLRHASWRTKVVLLALRLLGLVLALVLLLEPGIQYQQVSSTPGRVAVLLDTSRSMGLPAGDSGGTRMDRARGLLEEARGALSSLPSGLVVEPVAFSVDPEPVTWEGLLQAEPGGRRTDLLKALLSVLQPRPGKPLAGVLLVSDGADNVDLADRALSNEVRDRLALAGVPVHTHAVGSERGFKDVEVASVVADDFAFVRNPLEVDAVVTGRGYGAVEVPVTLKREGRVVAQARAKLRDEGGAAASATVTFKFEPREVGEAVYSVEAAEQVGEVLLENNRRAFTLKVIRDRIRVLQVAGRPSWDVRFLRKLLKENPSVDLISFFILRTHRDTTMVSQDELSLIPFPTRELFTEQLGTFDVVIFQNFNFGPYEMAGYLPNVRDFVVNKGGGFAMVGGELSFNEAQYDLTPVAEILPVELPPGRDHYVEEPYTPTVTPAGAGHPILTFAAGPAASVVSALPPFSGFNSVLGLKEGAEALLTHPSPPRGPPRQPVLAIREVGKGRTLSLSTDSLWFWALPDAGQGGRGTAHRELWANAIRWLIGDPALSRVRVEAASAAFDPQEPVVLRVRAFDPGYAPLAGAEVELTLESPDATAGSQPGARPRTVATRGETGPEGEWLVRLPNPGAGAYRARVTARARGVPLGTDEDAFLVRGTDRETAEASPRPELLAAISAATEGSKVTTADQVGKLRWRVPEGVRVHRRKSVPLWDQSWVGLLFAAVWALEWALRRRQGYA